MPIFLDHPIKIPVSVSGFFLLTIVLAPSAPAHAIPPFARQTGLECSACHTVYPQLTAYGRQFKMNGYVDGDVDTALYKKIGAWLQGSFTRTNKGQSGGAAPDFGENDNFALDQGSLFFGGRVIDKVGAFVQGTYDGIGKAFAWDNIDVRFANRGTVAGEDVAYGVSLNNSPSVTDPWNTTPVWSFPFDGSGLAPTPAASPLLKDGLGQIVIGASAFADWNSSIYGEVGLYHTLPRNMINALDVSSDGAPKSNGLAPYWRFAWHRDDGTNNFMVGTFGLYASLYPDGEKSAGADRYTDLGFDAQYQYVGDRDSVTVRGTLIHEMQDLAASATLGGADSATGALNSADASIAYLYDGTYQFSLGASHLWGGSDAALYGTPSGSPTSTSFTAQIDWLPFNKEPWSVYEWFNPRLSLQYVHYTRFDGSSGNVDGTGRDASDNDTLFLLLTATF